MKKFNTVFNIQNTEYSIQNTEYRHSCSVRGRGARFFSQSLRSWEKSAGFTMLELIIVFGIIAVLATVGIAYYAGSQRAKLIDKTSQEIAAYLKYAQQKSVSQEQGLQWGVHFENPSGGSDFYALYTGVAYTTPIETRYLPAGIEFHTPASGNSIDISYEKLTGLTSGGSYQQIILQNSVGLTKNVLSCRQGTISYDSDINTCFGSSDSTPPSIGAITASNTAYGSYLDSPFDLSAAVTEEQGGLTSCQYTINGGTNWYSASFSGSGPGYTCFQNNISASDGASLGLNMRATSAGGTITGTAINRTIDALAPTSSDNWTDNWTASSTINITLSFSDTGSGVASTKYCLDTSNNCGPSTSYTAPIAVSCASGSTCIQYCRYGAWDNVNNASSIYSKRIRQDLQKPTDGALTATPDINDCDIDLSWSNFSDNGSGIKDYKLVYKTDTYPSLNCTDGSVLYTGTQTYYSHSVLYGAFYYHVCATDNVNNISDGAGDYAGIDCSIEFPLPPTTSCLLAGSKILLKDYKLKNIEQIKTGDEIMSYDFNEQKYIPAKVLQTFQHQANEYLQIDLADGSRLKITGNHPVSIGNNLYRQAGELNTEDNVLTLRGLQQIIGIKTISQQSAVYNLEVSGFHNYFADGVLMHNKLAPWVGIPTP